MAIYVFKTKLNLGEPQEMPLSQVLGPYQNVREAKTNAIDDVGDNANATWAIYDSEAREFVVNQNIPSERLASRDDSPVVPGGGRIVYGAKESA